MKGKAIISLIVWTAVLGMCTQFSVAPNARAVIVILGETDGYTWCGFDSPYAYAEVDWPIITDANDIKDGDTGRFEYNVEYEDERDYIEPRRDPPSMATHIFTIRVIYGVANMRQKRYYTFDEDHGYDFFYIDVGPLYEDTYIYVKWEAEVSWGVHSDYDSQPASGWFELYLH